MKPGAAPRRVRLLLVGFGPVGRAFARLVEARRPSVAARHGLDLELVGIATSRSMWAARVPGPGPGDLARAVDGGASFDLLPGVEAGWDGTRAIGAISADVMLEATTTDMEAGEPAATHLHLALERGMHVAAASKGALVHRSAELGALARARGLQLRIGAATAAALPTVDFAEFCLAGAEIVRIEGILNGTSNYVLSRMQTDGSDYAEALRAARAKGIAEADPTLDVEGWDTAAKLVLIANALWGDAGLQLGDVAVRGITQLGPETLKKAGRSGAVVRLIGSLWWEAQALHATVEPRALGSDHPLAHVDGAEKGATFVTDTMDRLTVVGGRSSPTGAAAALLRDVINLLRG